MYKPKKSIFPKIRALSSNFRKGQGKLLISLTSCAPVDVFDVSRASLMKQKSLIFHKMISSQKIKLIC